MYLSQNMNFLKNFLKTIKNYFQHVPCTLELNIEYKYVLNVDLYL